MAELQQPAADAEVQETTSADGGGAEAGEAEAAEAAAPVTLTGAGDISWCVPPGIGSGEVTASLLDELDGALFTAGDNSNGDGTLEEYTGCFGPSWGRHLARIRPAPGNHDYSPPRPDGSDYHAYFGESAGPPGKGWYSYDLGSWHVVVLNNQCDRVDCDAGSEQEQWLRADLAAHPTRCALAIMHKPHFSGTTPTGSPYTKALWAALDEADVDVVLSAHLHWYERFKPQAPDGTVDPVRGIRQFIVGTGGAHQMVNSTGWSPASELHKELVSGVLRLTLAEDRYDWRFIAQAGKQYEDSGGESCH